MAAVRFRLLLAIALIAAAGCASQPERADNTAGAASAAAPTASASNAAAIQKMNKDIPSGLLVFAHDQGYEQVVMKGKDYYFCKTEDPMGSIIPVRQCVNESQLESLRIQVKQQREQLSRPGALNTQTGGG